MKTITLGQWLDGDDCPAFINGRQIETVTFQEGTRYDGFPRVFFTDGGDHVQLDNRYAFVDVEDDAERAAREANEAAAFAALDIDAASGEKLDCELLEVIEHTPKRREAIQLVKGSDVIRHGHIDADGNFIFEETAPAADTAGQAWGVIDGQTIDEAVVRRLIRQKMDALEKLRVTQFALNHALQTITRLEKELGGCTVGVFSITPAGYDFLREMGYGDDQPQGA